MNLEPNYIDLLPRFIRVLRQITIKASKADPPQNPLPIIMSEL